jgi:hypothetical protein
MYLGPLNDTVYRIARMHDRPGRFIDWVRENLSERRPLMVGLPIGGTLVIEQTDAEAIATRLLPAR